MRLRLLLLLLLRSGRSAVELGQRPWSHPPSRKVRSVQARAAPPVPRPRKPNRPRQRKPGPSPAPPPVPRNAGERPVSRGCDDQLVGGGQQPSSPKRWRPA